MRRNVWSALVCACAVWGCDDRTTHPDAMPELERALEASAQPGDEVVARVNGKEMTTQELSALWTQRPELDRAGALDALIEQELLSSEGVRRGLASPELQDGRKRGLSRALIEREITRDVEPSEAVVQVFRERETQKLSRPDGLVASHLLIRTTSKPSAKNKATPEQRERMVRALERAKGLLPAQPDASDLRAVARDLKEEELLGEDLTTHVDVRMTFPRLNQAGELPEGWTTLVRSFVEASEDAADGGRMGVVVGPVRTNFGEHLIVVHEKLDAPARDDAQIEARARNGAKNAELEVVFARYMNQLRKAHGWSVFPEALLEDAAGGS